MLLDKDKRFFESLMAKIIPSLDTKDLAYMIVKKMFQELKKKEPKKLTVYESHEIRKISNAKKS